MIETGPCEFRAGMWALLRFALFSSIIVLLARGMCGSATFPAQEAWDVWQCHGFAAGRVGCVAVPRFSRCVRGMRGSATLLLQKAWDVWQCHGFAAERVGCVAVPRFSRRERGMRAYEKPRSRPMTLTIPATTHATAHWNTTIPSAHLPPSSCLMDEIAATQGV